MAHVVVIGGGISGLSAALELQDHGLQVTLLEASERFGGPIRTERFDGWIVDAGPDSFLSTKPGALQLAERLGITERIVDTRSDGGGTYIVRAGSLHPLPEGITLLIPTDIKEIAHTKLLDRRGKLRLLADYLIPARRDDTDESVASFMRRRVGEQAFANLAEPLLSGIYAGDAERLGILSTFPRLRDVEARHGGLIRGALAIRRQSESGHSRAHTPFVSFASGMGEIIERILAELEPSDVRSNAAVTAIRAEQGEYRVEINGQESLDADGVILATPAPVSAKLLVEIAPAMARELRGIPYVSSATISMAFRAEDVAGRELGRGFVVPRVESRVLTAVTWSSNKFAGRTPVGTVLLRGFAGRAGREHHAELPDDELLDAIRADLAELTGVDADPLWHKVFRWKKAMPQYLVGHQDRLRRLDSEIAKHPGLALTGAAYRGVGIPDCISEARQIASQLGTSLLQQEQRNRFRRESLVQRGTATE